MRLETKKLLFDAQSAAKLIQSFTEGRSFTDYTESPMMRSAVERQFEIIGEAIGKLAKSDPGTASHIEEYHRIISFRNVLIHEYDVVSDEVVWSIVETRLPRLLATLDELLA